MIPVQDDERDNERMTQKLTESAIEEFAIHLFERQGYSSLYGPVKAKLKVIVKRTLRQFGYPPDMQLLATETVLKQAEMIAAELVG
jgi:type I restriction enzyme, R subunit